MKTVYPDFSEEVKFYAVGFDRSEDLSKLHQYAQNSGHPWPVAVGAGRIVRDLGITRQTYKVAIDGSGVQIFRATAGSDADKWRQVFTQLSEG